MIITQVSVFLENKAGSVERVATLLGDAGINIKTFTLDDGADFGILKMILSDAEAGYTILENAGLSVLKNDVVSVECPNMVGSISKLLKKLKEAGVSVEYIYSFQDGDVAKAILRSKDAARCNAIAEQK